MGGKGDDKLAGGRGGDELADGAGSDLYDFQRDFGADYIHDFDPTLNRLRFNDNRNFEVVEIGDGVILDFGNGTPIELAHLTMDHVGDVF